MKRFLIRIFPLVVFLAASAAAQQIIPLYSGPAPGSVPANYPEKEYFSNVWHTEVVANVTQPSLIAFKPVPTAPGL